MSETGLAGQPSPGFACGRPRAIALDFDGTLTDGDRPSAETLAALADIRDRGIRVILVTGRILPELQATFGDVAEHFDALVMENGAVAVIDHHVRAVALPIDGALLAKLREAGVHARQGTVIVATSNANEHKVLDIVGELGLECQLVRNRTELMVLPSGVNKGSGLMAVLGSLGLSAHDCIAVGDAENDHSLLAAAELGLPWPTRSIR